MEIQPPESRASVSYAQAKPSGIKEHVLLKMGVFMMSVAAGYLFTLSLHTGLRLLAHSSAGTHENVNPLIEVLRLLYSGFGR